jgi:hypothetical protein
MINCECGHSRLEHEFSEDCSMCWHCKCTEFTPVVQRNPYEEQATYSKMVDELLEELESKVNR